MAKAAAGFTPTCLTLTLPSRSTETSALPLDTARCFCKAKPINSQLLPALPSAWPTGHVTGIAARGGFEVDIRWKNGKLIDAVVRSKSGLPCKVVYGDQTWEFPTEAGKSYPVELKNSTVK